MILVTHTVVGGALAGATGANPAIAFVIGFVSHFVLDAIPHWDYNLKSSKKDPNGDELKNDIVLDRRFIFDLLKIGGDFLLGIILALIIVGGHARGGNLAVICGALGGVFPDILQFAYFKLRTKPLLLLQRFHLWIHARTTLKHRPYFGASIQLCIVVVIWAVGLYLK